MAATQNGQEDGLRFKRPIRAALLGSFSFAGRATGALPRGGCFCSAGARLLALPAGGGGPERLAAGAPFGAAAAEGAAPSLRGAFLDLRVKRRGLDLRGSAELVLAITNFPHSQTVNLPGSIAHFVPTQAFTNRTV